jgi:hypothetical protein
VSRHPRLLVVTDLPDAGVGVLGAAIPNRQAEVEEIGVSHVGQRTVRYRGAEFTVNEGPGATAFFVLGVRKSGSSLLNNLVKALAEKNGLNFVDVAGTLFKHGVAVSDWQTDASLADVLAPGNVYGGFRNCPTSLEGAPLFREGRKVLLVRDPRDALVSEYFSNAYSHSVPAGGESREGLLKLRERALESEINHYVMEMSRALKRTLQEYLELAGDRNCRVFRYEDVIFDKKTLIGEICSFFGWTVSDHLRELILGWADVRPSEERPTEFVRRVTPGDHREKLRPDVIARLTGLFSEEMTRFGYARA